MNNSFGFIKCGLFYYTLHIFVSLPVTSTHHSMCFLQPLLIFSFSLLHGVNYLYALCLSLCGCCCCCCNCTMGKI